MPSHLNNPVSGPANGQASRSFRQQSRRIARTNAQRPPERFVEDHRVGLGCCAYRGMAPIDPARPWIGRLTCHAVVTAVPFDKPAQSLGQRRRGEKPTSRCIAEISAQGLEHVPCLHRKKIPDRRLSNDLLERRDEIEQIHRLVVADVVDAIRRRTCGTFGPLRIPSRIRRSGAIQGADHASAISST